MTEHLTYFDSGSTVNQAAIWLGTLQQQRQSYDEAIESYMAVSPDYEKYNTIIQNLEVCWIAKLRQEKSENQLNDAKALTDHLRSLIFDKDTNASTMDGCSKICRYGTCRNAGHLFQR